MALPTTSLSFSALQTEFGGSNPISLSEYYRGAGGGWVPSGTTSAYGTIPTSGQISLGVFRGTSDFVFVPGSNTFTANASFTVPAGYSTITLEAWGGGGGGGSAAALNLAFDGPTALATTITGTGVSISAGGGIGGGYANTSQSPGPDGAGGTASGGTTSNVNGASGNSASGGTAPSGSVVGGAGGAHGFSTGSAGSYVGTSGSAPGGGGGGSEFEQAFKAGGGLFDSGSGGSGAYVKTISSTIPAGTVLTITVPPITSNSATAALGGLGRVIITYS